jgi:hypothetical protein
MCGLVLELRAGEAMIINGTQTRASHHQSRGHHIGSLNSGRAGAIRILRIGQISGKDQ